MSILPYHLLAQWQWGHWHQAAFGVGDACCRLLTHEHSRDDVDIAAGWTCSATNVGVVLAVMSTGAVSRRCSSVGQEVHYNHHTLVP